MADFTPIASLIKPPQALSVGDMLNIAQGAQAYQQAQQINPLKVEQQQAFTQQQQTQAQQANIDLGFHQKSLTASYFGGLLTDPSFNPNNPNPTDMVDKINKTIDNLKSMNIDPKYIDQSDKLLDIAKNNPTQAIQIIKNGVQQTLGTAAQGAQLNQPYNYANVATPQGIQATPIAASPYQQGTNYGATYTPSIQPGQQQEVGKDLLGNPILVNKNAAGIVSNVQPLTSGQPAPMLSYPVGESEQTKQTLEKDRQDVNSAAAAVPNQHFFNGEIVNFAKNGFTGTLSPALQKAAGVIGTDMAADTASLNHFLALQQEASAKAMGANTDASRAIAGSIAGTATTPQAALIRQAKINDAMSTGVQLYNQGMENAINNPQNKKGIFTMRDYKNDWSNNFDPRAMIFYQANQEMQQNGKLSPETQDIVDSVKKQIGFIPGKPLNQQPVYVKDLFQKTNNLTKLINQGHL